MQSLYEGTPFLHTRHRFCKPSELILILFLRVSEASKLLIDNELHRLPLLDTAKGHESIISVITQYKILKYIAANVSIFVK